MELEAVLFTQLADSLAYVVLCLSVWGVGEGIVALLDRPNTAQHPGCWIRRFRRTGLR